MKHWMQAKQKKSPNDQGMGSLPKETLKKMELSKTNGIKKLFNHKSTPEITPAEQHEALKKEKAAKFKINLHEMRKSEDSRASTPQNYFSNCTEQSSFFDQKRALILSS